MNKKTWAMLTILLNVWGGKTNLNLTRYQHGGGKEKAIASWKLLVKRKSTELKNCVPNEAFILQQE